jgi:hypothetical protein
VSDTVLIAPPDKLPALLERPDLATATTYSDADSVAALDAIVQRRPAVVALDQGFADSPRGLALIERIKGDPALETCDIRIIGERSDAARLASAGRVTPEAGNGSSLLDAHVTRRVARVTMREGLTVSVDGNPATLLDLSGEGAQVLSSMTLRPHQHVRVALPDSPRPIRLRASVRWATFEMPKEGPRFRAGLQFTDADLPAVDRFIAAHRAV